MEIQLRSAGYGRSERVAGGVTTAADRASEHRSKMSTSHQRKKDTEATVRRLERDYHDVPAEWAAWGRHQDVPETHERFYAEKICHEYRFVTWPIGHDRAGAEEIHKLYVLYRNPETGEKVERMYGASVGQTDGDTVRVWCSESDAPDERVEYPVLPVELDDWENYVVLPSIVRDGEPQNFRTSIAVHPEEPRVGEGQEGGE